MNIVEKEEKKYGGYNKSIIKLLIFYKRNR